MELKIQIDETCEQCQVGLKYLKKLQKRNKKAYGCFILHPIERFSKRGRDLGEEDRIQGLELIPDYNHSGYLTHFHIKKTEMGVKNGNIYNRGQS